MDELNAVLKKRTDIGPGLMILEVAPVGWEIPDYKAGQFTVLGLSETAPRHPEAKPENRPPVEEGKKPKLIRKAYSISSAPGRKDAVEFYITMVGEGELTPRLFQLKEGDRLHMGPKFTGTFTLATVPEDANLVLVATGTGLAPYLSMLRHGLATSKHAHWAVLHGVRHAWELGYRDELEAMAKAHPSLAYFPTVSRPQLETTPWSGLSGYVQDVWSKGLLEKAWGFRPKPADTHFFFCGNPKMIEDFVKVLSVEGFTEHKPKAPGPLHLEKYW